MNFLQWLNKVNKHIIVNYKDRGRLIIMCEIEEKSVEIKVTEKFATDENGEDQYRYVLIKEWGQADKPVVVIMYNPSDADYLMYDKTL